MYCGRNKKNKKKLILIRETAHSNPCAMATFGTPKKWLLFRGGRYSEVPPIKLILIWDVWGSGWSLLTGGLCSEVVVNTGLTVYIFFSVKIV
jgi:hypothetical protein